MSVCRSERHIQKGEWWLQAERLAVADKHRVEGARDEAAHEYYSQFPFRPAINERSRRLVKVRSTSTTSNGLPLCKDIVLKLLGMSVLDMPRMLATGKNGSWPLASIHFICLSHGGIADRKEGHLP